MPTCTICQPGKTATDAAATIGNGKQFTGSVHREPVLSAEGITVANVNFSPGARTNWHYHAGGQLLRVLAGRGWVCDKGGEPKRIAAGDIIWCPAGTTHWHGADADSFMIHQAVSHGGVKWYDSVGDDEYKKAKESGGSAA